MTNLTNRGSFFSPAKSLAAAALALLTVSADAQVFDVGLSTNNRGWHQAASRRNMVRFGTSLFSAVVLQNGTVQLRRKNDDTTSPWASWLNVNTSTTGIGSTNPTTTVSMAVSSAGCLHITWGRYYYPSFFRQYYRCFRLGTGFTHAPQDITAYVSASSLTRTDSMAIAVGAKDFVYMSAQNGTSSWRSRLLQSVFVNYPTGTAPAWTNRGSIAGNSASSTNVRMSVDSGGLLHMSFYNNVSPGQYATRIFRPAPATWYAQDQIGVPPSPRDDDGYLASDWGGYTHILYKHLVNVTAGVSNYQLRFRSRLGTAAWTTPIVVHSFTSTDVGTNSARSSYALAAGRRVFAIYHDYNCGRLMVKQKKFTATSFEFLSEMRPASTGTNEYFMPNVRSTLWPQSNGLLNYLDITFRRPSGSTYRLYHQRLHVTAMDVDLTGCAGTCGVPAITVGGVPCSTGPRVAEIGVERARAGAPAFMLWTLNPTFSMSFGCGTLVADNYFPPPVIVNPCCTAKKVIPLLPGGCTTWVYFQWAIFDSGAVGGFALSNRGKLHL